MSDDRIEVMSTRSKKNTTHEMISIHIHIDTNFIQKMKHKTIFQ